MKICPTCQSRNVALRNRLLTRLLLSIYMFLNFYFFTGEIDYGAVIALAPLIIPYHHVCMDCRADHWGAPEIRVRNFWPGNFSDRYLLAMAPTILTVAILILSFPYTGLERIVYLPSIYAINSIPILIFLINFKKLSHILNFFLWLLIEALTVLLSILLYPQ